MTPSKATRRAEGRGRLEGTSHREGKVRTQGRGIVPAHLGRVNEAAKRDKRARFTALLHHVDVVALERAFRRVKRKAAPGVDGETVESYEENLQERLRGLCDRVHRGSYRPQPVRRVYIPKAGGGQRPIGVPALEDKVVQGAVAEVLSAIYEAEMFETLTALANEGPYKVESVNARTVVEDCLAELRAQPALGAREDAYLLAFSDESTQKQVSATFSAEGTSFIVRGDGTMLARAVSYLIFYLLRRTPEQEARLAVSIARLEKEDRVRITVASRTADVRADELRAIFDPIQAVQENLIDVGPCVSQRIVEAQGGRLEVRHSRGEVSFSITLPGAGA
jgi:hypothetical protein